MLIMLKLQDEYHTHGTRYIDTPMERATYIHPWNTLHRYTHGTRYIYTHGTRYIYIPMEHAT